MLRLTLAVVLCLPLALAPAAAQESKGKDAWKPVLPRPRKVSKALRAYAAMTTSASKGAIRVVPEG